MGVLWKWLEWLAWFPFSTSNDLQTNRHTQIAVFPKSLDCLFNCVLVMLRLAHFSSVFIAQPLLSSNWLFAIELFSIVLSIVTRCCCYSNLNHVPSVIWTSIRKARQSCGHCEYLFDISHSMHSKNTKQTQLNQSIYFYFRSGKTH